MRVYLNRPLSNPLYSQHIKPFPVHLFKDPAILKSTLVYTACIEAMVFLYRFTIELLQGQIPLSESHPTSTYTNLVYTDICSEIKEITISMIKHGLQIYFSPDHSPKINTPQSIYHNIYRVVLKHGKVWTIDPTGAQFSYYKPLCS
jgi:hypothetical protein